MRWLTLVYNFTKLHIAYVCVHNWRWKLCIHADAGAIKVVEPPSSGQSHMNSDAESSMKENSELAQLALLLLYWNGHNDKPPNFHKCKMTLLSPLVAVSLVSCNCALRTLSKCCGVACCLCWSQLSQSGIPHLNSLFFR